MSYLSHYLAQVTGPCIGETLYLETVTLTVSDEVFAEVILGGAGGSGGVAAHGTDNALAIGGNAGGVARKLIRMKPSVNYTITIRTGGAAVSRIASAGATAGNAGGDTDFSSSDGVHSMTAYGGNGGTASTETSDNAIFTLSPAALKSGTGGHNHYNGGRGGSISVDYMVTGTDAEFATGGGGVNLRGAADGVCDGGDIDIEDTGGASASGFATGGGGIGGRGGDITGLTVGARDFNSGGGSAFNDGVDIVDATDSVDSIGGAAGTHDSGDNLTGYWQQPNGVGGYGDGIGGSVNGGDAAGGAGGTSIAGDGGLFGGGGGCANSNGSGDAGVGGLGAGGGGGSEGATTAYSGAGGDGWAVVRLFAIPGKIL